MLGMVETHALFWGFQENLRVYKEGHSLKASVHKGQHIN